MLHFRVRMYKEYKIYMPSTIFLWENYSENEVNDKIKYFADIWTDIFNNNKSNSFCIKLFNPHTILTDIKEEIIFNYLQKEELRKFFIEQTGFYLNNDNIIKKHFTNEFKLIIEYIQRKDLNCLTSIVNKCIINFSKGKYYDLLYNQLETILLNNDLLENTKETIKYISQCIIVELILKGYSYETLDKLIENIFDSGFKREGLFFSSYPIENVIGDSYDPEYSTKRETFIKSLTMKDRLQNIFTMFHSEVKDLYCIFPVEGLISKEITEQEIAEIIFYNPKKTNFIVTDYRKTEEVKKENTIECAIPITSIDINQAPILAVEKFQQFTNIAYHLKDISAKISLLSNECVITDKNRKILSARNSLTEQQTQEISYLAYGKDVNVFDKEIFNKLYEFLYLENNETAKKIINSLTWMRKAKDSKQQEDKLVYYWIAMENLFDYKNEFDFKTIVGKNKLTKDLLIKELMISICTESFVFDKTLELYNYINSLLGRMGVKADSEEIVQEINLSSEIIRKCDLLTKESFTLDNFVENIKCLEDSIDKMYIKQKIIEVRQIIYDNDFAYSSFRERIKNVKDDITNLYKYRNMVVHNGYFNELMLPYYVKKIEFYSNKLLWYCINKYYFDNSLTLKAIFHDLFVSKELFLEALKNKKITNTYKYVTKYFF